MDDDLRDQLAAHITRTDQRFENLTDIVTRVAHATEQTQLELNSHKTWEEGYHREETSKHDERHKQITERIDKMHEDLSLYFRSKTTVETLGGFGVWLAKLGIFGAALLWLWSNALHPMLKKFGVL